MKFKLNSTGRKELRKNVVEALNNYDQEEKKQLPKDVLEELLFEKVSINNTLIKIPVWSGNFLRKLDLSEIDFNNVSWSILHLINVNNSKITIGKTIITNQSIIKRLQEIRMEAITYNDDSIYLVNYSNTNAHIDLTKSYEFKYENTIDIPQCNFSNIDLYDQDIYGIKRINLYYSDISNTGLRIPNNITIDAMYSNLENINLSTRIVDINKYLLKEIFYNSNIKNSHIKFILNPQDFSNKEIRDTLNNALKDDIVGCFINGVYIKTPEEKQQTKNKIRNEYSKYQEKVISDVLIRLKKK